MRGAITFIVALFFLTAFIFVGVLVVEPISDVMANDEAVQDNEHINGDEWASDLRGSLFIWVPLTFLGVMLVWGVSWYYRREAGVRRR